MKIFVSFCVGRNYFAILLNSLRCALGYVQQPFRRKLTMDLHAIMMQKGSTSHIYGSSVRCRRHIQPTKIIFHLAWAHKSGGKTKPIPSHSSGEGVWGRGASLREAASPPAPPPPTVFSGGSAREGTFLQKSPLPRNHPHAVLCSIANLSAIIAMNSPLVGLSSLEATLQPKARFRVSMRPRLHATSMA